MVPFDVVAVRDCVISNSGGVTHFLPNNGFCAKQLESAKMVQGFFFHCDEDISKLLNDEDSKNTKIASK